MEEVRVMFYPLIMNELTINNGILSYACCKETWNKEVSWELSLSSITLIGVLGRMVGDDDFVFIVFIDSNKKIYPLNCTHPQFKGELVLRSLIEEKGINYDGLFKQDDQNCVIYPSELNGIKLFRQTFFDEVKVFFDLRHAATGEIEKVVVAYIDTRP